MKRLDQYPFLIRVIEQWPARLRQAGLRQKELAKLADLSVVTVSQTITLTNKNPKLSTIQRIEDILKSKGV